MSCWSTKHCGTADLAARVGVSCAVLLGALLLSTSAVAVRPRTVIVLAGPGEAERTAELKQALTAHLIDSGVEPRVVAVDRRPACPPSPGDASYEEHLTDDAVSLVWLSESGDRFCTLTPEIDDEVNERSLPDSGEGWASRADMAASMVYSELEPLVRRDAESDRGRRDEPYRYGVAPRVGLDVPTSDLEPFLVAAVEVDFFLPIWNRRVALAIDLSFTRPGHSGRGFDPRIGGDYRYEVDVLQLKGALDLVFRFADQRSTPIPFLGVGAVCQYILTEQTTTITAGANTEWSFEPGFEVLAGLDVPLGPGFLIFDFRYIFTNLDHRFAGDTNAGNVTTAAGYRFVF